VLLCSLCTGTSMAADQSAAGCHAIADPTGRLLCYDRITGRPQPAEPAAYSGPRSGPETKASAQPVPPAPAAPQAETVTPAAAAPDAPPRSTRGLRPPPPPSAAPDEPSRIVRLERTSIGRTRFHLANGEIWEQLEAGSITVREGDLVNVRQTTFGAWQLRETDKSSRSVRVRRVE
jgi:hypothetical protein